MADKDLSRFLSYVEKEGDCWLWKGGTDVKSYGVFWYKGKTQFAHRVSLLLHNRVEQLNPSLQVLHSCRNTSCVNPDHLSEGTRQQNCADKKRDGTALTGDRCHFSKLTWQKISEIRRKSEEPRKKLAEEYGVTANTIGSILLRKSWISIDE